METPAKVIARENSLTRLRLKGRIQKVTEQLSLFYLDRAQKKYRRNDKRYSQWESSIPELKTPHIPDKRTGESVLVRQEAQDNKERDKEYGNTKSSESPHGLSRNPHGESQRQLHTHSCFTQLLHGPLSQDCCQKELLYQVWLLH